MTESRTDPPARILLVDDAREALDVLVELLQGLGYDIETASTGEEAMALLATHEFELVLTDIRLPEATGLDVMRFAKTRDPEICVIVVTGSVSVATAVDALRHGAYDYVQKPFDLWDVSQIIAKGIERRRLAIENRVLLASLNKANEEVQQHEEVLREKVRVATGQMRTLYEIGQQISRTLSLDRTLGVILEKAVDLSSAAAGLLHLRSETEASFVCPLAHGLGAFPSTEAPGALPETHGRILPGRGLVGRVAAGGGPLRERLADPLADLGIEAPDMNGRAALVVPLTSQGVIIGTLAVLGTEGREFTGDDETVLVLFAAQAAIAIANAQLYERTLELDRLKSEFVAVVSHEVRTPLTSIKGSLELLGDHSLFELSAPQRELFAICTTNVDRLVTLISDILDFSRMESSRLPMQIEPIDLASLLREATNRVRTLTTQKGQTLVLRFPDMLPPVLADAGRIVQVLTNLLGNAVKFGGDGTAIAVETLELPDALQVSVSDEGPGIDPQDVPKLFRKFQQLDSSTTRKAGGTGLGLVISKGIVEQHGGRLSAEPNTPKGMTFRLQLPLRRSEAA